jgi:hypothetical protein
MRHPLAAICLSLTLLGAFALPTSACINDREVNTKQREFKSQYHEDAPQYTPEPLYSPSTTEKLLSFVAVAAGSVMLTSACVFCLKRK